MIPLLLLIFLLYHKRRGFTRGDGTFFGFRNLGEGLCASWALPLVECVGMSCKKSGGLLLCNDRSGAETTGSFSDHTATHSTSESAHETQSFSTELRKTKKDNASYGEGRVGVIDPRRIEGPLKLMQPKSLQKAKRVASVLK